MCKDCITLFCIMSLLFAHTNTHVTTNLAHASFSSCLHGQLLFISCSVNAAELCGKDMLRHSNQPAPVSVLPTTTTVLKLWVPVNLQFRFINLDISRAIITYAPAVQTQFNVSLICLFLKKTFIWTNLLRSVQCICALKNAGLVSTQRWVRNGQTQQLCCRFTYAGLFQSIAVSNINILLVNSTL